MVVLEKDECLKNINEKLAKKVRLRKGSWYVLEADLYGSGLKQTFKAKLIDREQRFLLFRTEAGYKTSVLKMNIVNGEVKIKGDK